MNPFLLALLVTVTCSAVQQSSTKVTPRQELEFAWPSRIDAQVEVERRRQRDDGKSAAQSSLVRGRYRMQVLPHDGGRLIRYDRYEHLHPALARGEMLGEVISSWMPSIIVSADGAFQRIEDIAPLKRAVDEVFAQVGETSKTMPPALKDMLATMTSEAYLTRAAAQEWQVLVGSWVGVPVATDTIELTAEEPSPLWPDTTIAMKMKIEVAAVQPCPRAGSSHECVTIQLTSVPDSAAAQSLLRRLMEGHTDLHAMKYERFDVKTVVRVTLETATMLPHHLASQKTITVAATTLKGERVDATQVEHKMLKFTYTSQVAERN